ncbi:MAG: ABC transporter substrate-binding protein [Gammaproteobacteria bacterium]|nr:ABC transporter substrate-binding protein [Gammaproteobacteria bacterium]
MPPVLRSEVLPDRRRFLGRCLAGALALSGLAACERREPLLRIASNVWPGYELIRLAAARGYFTRDAVRLIEMPSAVDCIHSLAAGTLEGACLTLDEVLTALAGGVHLKVVCVLDVSLGADVLLARPDIQSLQGLKGRRIGVEQSGSGAVMLAAALQQAGLGTNDVTIIQTPLLRQREAFLSGQVDALITFEPIPTQLQGTDVIRLFSSADIPGRIVDVLAVRPKALEQSPEAVRQLLAGHFRARAEFLSEPATALPILAGLLRLSPAQVPAAFVGIDLLDATANRQWLGGMPGKLEQTAAGLAQVMRQAGLLRGECLVASLADARFLPKM